MAKEGTTKSIFVVHFRDAVNVGAATVTAAEASKLKGVTFEKTATGIWIKREGHRDRWVPDANIRWIEFAD